MSERIRIKRIVRPNAFPPLWVVYYRHPTYGPVVQVRRTYASAIEYADRLRIRGEA